MVMSVNHHGSMVYNPKINTLCSTPTICLYIEHECLIKSCKFFLLPYLWETPPLKMLSVTSLHKDAFSSVEIWRIFTIGLRHSALNVGTKNITYGNKLELVPHFALRN